MKIQTLSIVAGTKACDAQCPYCISKMTPETGAVAGSPSRINYTNLIKSLRFAVYNRVTTVLITGKGEPCLFPDQVTYFLKVINNDLPNPIPFVEMQTNGMQLWQHRNEPEMIEALKFWHQVGLNTIAISIVHYDDEANREIFQPNGDYLKLPNLIRMLHDYRFTVRLSCTMFKGGIDSTQEIDKLICFAKKHGAEQLSVHTVEKPHNTNNEDAKKWVEEHYISKETIAEFKDYYDRKGTEILRLVHGAVVYDVGGQNFCLTNCLTIDPSREEELRQLIFSPDGHLRYDWQFEGAILF